MRKTILFIGMIVLAPMWSLAQGDFEDFYKDFLKAIKKHKTEKVISMSVLPMMSWDLGPELPSQIEGEMNLEVTAWHIEEHFDQVFSAETQSNLAISPIVDMEDLYSQPSPCVVFFRDEYSSAWFIFQVVEGEWKWVGTDNVSG